MREMILGFNLHCLVSSKAEYLFVFIRCLHFIYELPFSVFCFILLFLGLFLTDLVEH